MNALAQSRRVDRALVRAWRKAVFADSALAGRVHRVESGWLAETSGGRLLGSFESERDAVGAVLNAGRRA